MTHSDFDVAVIGAGIAGLTCAQQLSQAGYRVVVVEKSRGVGGRVATRRVQGTCADHGACYLTPQGEAFRALVDRLLQAGVLQPWTNTVYELGADGCLQEPQPNDRYPRYVAANGMTAIAKFLAAGIEIRLKQRVHGLELDHKRGWQLMLEEADAETLEAKRVTATALVVAIPAPQAATILQPLSPILSVEFLARLESVEFLPCISAIAGYPVDRQQEWLADYPLLRAVTFTDHPDLAWLGLDSSKRKTTSQPVFVVQSTAAFADRHLEATDLQAVGEQLLRGVADQLAPWLAVPEWLQVHRWRYAFARSPLSELYLSAPRQPETANGIALPPLVCTGDWCGGRKIESAFLAGLATAQHLSSQLAS